MTATVMMMMMAMMMMMTMEDQIVALSMFVITGFFIIISYYRIFTTIISMLSFICIIKIFFKRNRYYLSVSSQNVSQFSFCQYHHHHFILDPEIFLGKEGICFICSLPNVFRSPTPPCLDLLIARIGITFGAAFTILIIVRLISIIMMTMTMMTMMTTMMTMKMRKMRITIIRV